MLHFVLKPLIHSSLGGFIDVLIAALIVAATAEVSRPWTIILAYCSSVWMPHHNKWCGCITKWVIQQKVVFRDMPRTLGVERCRARSCCSIPKSFLWTTNFLRCAIVVVICTPRKTRPGRCSFNGTASCLCHVHKFQGCSS